MPKISFASALPVGIESIHETMNLQIYETTPIPSLKERINQMREEARIKGAQADQEKTKADHQAWKFEQDKKEPVIWCMTLNLVASRI